MGKLDKDIFVCIDCETTGLNAEKDAIMEVAGIRFCGDEVLDRFESLVDPECAISETSIKITNITQEMVTGKPKIRDVLDPMIKLIGRYPIIGHGIGFDIAVLTNASKKNNIPCPITNNLSIDTLRMARLYGGSAVNSLEQLRKHFNIPAGDAHRAMSDVIVNVALFNQLAKNHRSTEALSKCSLNPSSCASCH